jgi:hypothetical protein
MTGFAGHGDALYVLIACTTVLIGFYGYFHARNFWEGLPPVLDAFVSMAGFVGTLAAFAVGGRVGGLYGHPHAGRVLAVALVAILYRSLRTWIGNEQVKYRKVMVGGRDRNN